MEIGINDRPVVHVTEHIHPVAADILERVTNGIEGRSADTDAVIVRDCQVSEDGIRETSRDVYDPYLPDDRWPSGGWRVFSLDEALSSSDLLFVHMPLPPDTALLLGQGAIKRMPQGAYLVNCSHGGIVDDSAQADALASGRLAGPASEVFETEPPSPDHAQLRQSNFISTPHIAASTNLGLERGGSSVVLKVLCALGADADYADRPKEEE